MVAQVDYRFIRLSLKKSFTRYLSYAFYEGRPLTTKGRWINPLVFFLFRMQLILPSARKVVKPIFIVGVGRSGTTILGVTLGMHNDVGFLNEPKALWSFLFHKEDLIGSYQSKEGSYRLSASSVDSSLIKNAHQVYGNYLRFACASRIVDKYPELIFRTDFISAIFPDARFLFLYRDGNDTCHSIRRWSTELGVKEKEETHDWWGRDDRKWNLLCDQIVKYDDSLGVHIKTIRKYNNHEYRAAVEWIVTMKEGLALLNSKSNCVLGVKYENYVACLKTRQEVLRFCGLSSDVLFDKFCKSILKVPESKPRLKLPIIIQDEFNNVMTLLGYEAL